jgi:hypothetical protein
VPSWRPLNPSSPDELDEWRFRPLADTAAALTERLAAHFAPRWLQAARLPMSRLSEVPDTVEFRVAETWDPADGTKTLRLTSWYTGETRWLYGWDGRYESAAQWIEQVVEDFGDWVLTERELYGSAPPWDE